MSAIQESQSFLWSRADVLGKGATAAVYRGVNKVSGDPAAVKCFFSETDDRFREFDVLTKLRHENIVELITLENTLIDRRPVIVMELCKGGSLMDNLMNPKNAYGLEESEFLLVLKHLTAGIKYLRENDIVHRDLKPGNIMRYIREDGSSVYKVTDFGFARELRDNETFESICGTEQYLSPDIYKIAILRMPSQPRKFNSSVDLWSLAVTLYHAVTGVLPFRAYNSKSREGQETLYRITTQKEVGVISGIQTKEKGPIVWRRELPETCLLSDGLKKLITPLLAGILEANHSRMWSFQKFFTEVDKLLSYQAVYIFYANHGRLLEVYLLPDQKYVDLQQAVMNETQMEGYKQILLYKNDLLINCIRETMTISEFPKTSKEKPLFLFNKTYDNVPILPVEIPKWCDFPTDISGAKDILPARSACNVGYFCKTHIDRYSTWCKLIYSAFECFIDYLTMRIKQLQLKSQHFFEKLCAYKDPVKILHENKKNDKSPEDKLVSITTEFATVTALQVTNLFNIHCVENNLMSYWNDAIKNVKCPYSTRASARAASQMEDLMESNDYFMKQPMALNEGYNRGQWHIVQRKKVRCRLKTITALLNETFPQYQELVKIFQTWYQSASKVYFNVNTLETEIMQAEEKLRGFQKYLSMEYNHVNQSRGPMSSQVMYTKNVQLLKQLEEYHNSKDNFSSIYSENTKLVNNIEELIKNIKI